MSRLMFSVLLAGTMLAPTLVSAEEVVVYSARKEHLIKPLFDRYTEETGVSISYITDKAGPLLQRLRAEGKRTPADMLITVDAGNLWHAAESGVLKNVNEKYLEEIRGFKSFVAMEIFLKPGQKVSPTVDCFTFVGNMRLTHNDEAVVTADYERVREIESSDDFLIYE